MQRLGFHHIADALALEDFGLRIHPSGRKVWIVQARIEGRSRRIVIARHGEMELAEARRPARHMLARIRAGQNPADDIRREKETPAFREFAAESAALRSALEALGTRDRAHLSQGPHPARLRQDAARPHRRARRGRVVQRGEQGQAGRGQPRLRDSPRDDVPGRGVGFAHARQQPLSRYREEPKEPHRRFLDTDELARLGRALDARDARWPEAVAAIQLLALTGCRRGEVLTLRWRDIGADAINLADSKTGPRAVPLGKDARAQIDALPGKRRPGAFLFPKLAEGRYSHNLVVCWRAVCEDARLGKLRLHDLRHTAASHAVMSGENLPLVGKLLGHRRHRTTAGYAHLADGHLVEAAERVGRIIAEAMEGEHGG